MTMEWPGQRSLHGLLVQNASTVLMLGSSLVCITMVIREVPWTGRGFILPLTPGCDWSMTLYSGARSFIYHNTWLDHKLPERRTSTLMTEASCSYETLMYIRWTVCFNVPETHKTVFWTCRVEGLLTLCDCLTPVRPAEGLVKGNLLTCLAAEPNMSWPWKADFIFCLHNNLLSGW